MKEENTKERRKYTLLLILCTVIGTAIIIIGGYFWFIKKPEGNNGTPTPTPTIEPTTNTDEGEGPISVTRDGVMKKENVPDGMAGKYVLKGQSNSFTLYSDGTAEADITFSGPDLPSADDKTFFTKEELTFKLIYEGDNFYLELVPNESLDEVYKQWFGDDGEYYYAGKIENGVYHFEVVNPSAISNPGDTYIKQ